MLEFQRGSVIDNLLLENRVQVRLQPKGKTFCISFLIHDWAIKASKSISRKWGVIAVSALQEL